MSSMERIYGANSSQPSHMSSNIDETSNNTIHEEDVNDESDFFGSKNGVPK